MPDIQFFPDFDDDGSNELTQNVLRMIKEEDDTNTHLEESITVYLAGPMEAYLEEELPYSIKWRDSITKLFDQVPDKLYRILDPNRGKTDGTRYVRNEKNAFQYNSYTIFSRDLQDVKSSDVVIANLNKKVFSFGTPFELGYAYASNIPIIVILSEDGDTSKFLSECATAIAYSLDEAVGIVNFMFNENCK